MKYLKNRMLLVLSIFFLLLMAFACKKDELDKEVKLEVDSNLVAGFSYEYTVKLGKDAGTSYQIYDEPVGIIEIDDANHKINALAEGEVVVNIITDKNVIKEFTLTVQAPLTYTITYHLDGGVDAGLIPSYTSASGDVVLENPTKEGFTFAGWYDNAEFTGEAITKINKGEKGNKEFYAKWEVFVEKYTITFDTQGGKAVDPIEFTPEDGIISLQPTERPGYIFMGWATQLSGGTIITEVEAARNKTNMVLYARWQLTEFVISYELNGGEIEMAPLRYTVEKEVVLIEPVKPGYKFDGWYDNAEFTGEAITKIEVGSTGDIKFFAKWGDAYYTVSWDLAGGAWDGEEGVKTFDMYNPLTLPTPVKDGYTFLGWFQDDIKVSEVEYKNYELVAKWHSDAGETIYVGLNGYDSLEKALMVALDNDTIVVSAGTWAGGTITQNNIKIIGANENVNPNTAERAPESFINTDITVLGNNVEINGIGLTDKGRIVVSGDKLVENLTVKYIHVVECTLNLNASDSATAPLTLYSTGGVKNVTLANSRFEQAKGRAMILSGNLIENLTVINNVFLGTSSAKGSYYNDGIKMDNNADYGIKGKLLVQGNEFSDYGQYVIWANEYGAGTYDIIDNKFTNIGITPGSHAIFTTFTPVVEKGEKVTINVMFNILENCMMLARLQNEGFTAETFEAHVNYNIVNNCGGTYWVTNNDKNTLNLIDATLNYYGPTAPEASKFKGVSEFSPLYTNIDDVPSYAEHEGIFFITYELDGGKYNDSLPVTYKKGEGVSELGTPTKEGYVFVGFVDAEGNAVTEIKADAEGDITLYAVWREDCIYVGTEDYAYATLAEALAAAKEGDKIIVLAGTYAEDITINVNGLTLSGAKENEDLTLNDAILTGKITVAANDVTIKGLAFTGGSKITSAKIVGFKFTNNYVYDTTATTVAWGEASTPALGWMVLNGKANSTQVTDTEIANNYFKNVGDTCVSMSYIKNVTIYGNKFEDFLYDGVRFDNGGYNEGLISITNNEFVQNEQGGTVAVYFRIYGGAGQNTEINIKGNTFKNVGYYENNSIYLGAISGRNYQEHGAYITISDNDFIECKNIIRLRNNATATNHAASIWSCVIENNNIIGVPQSYYFANKNASDGESTNPSLTEVKGNFYADSTGAKITPNSALFFDTKSVAEGLEEKVEHQEIKDVKYYSIQYVLNGGKYAGTLISRYNTAVEEIILPIPTRINYIFEGWYIGQEKYEVITGDMGQNVILEAVWKFDDAKYITVEAELNGGNWSYESYDEIALDLLNDYNVFGGTSYTRTSIPTGPWVNIDFHNFFYSEVNGALMSKKWGWLTKYLAVVGGPSNAKACGLLLSKTDAAGFDGINSNYKYAVSYEFRGFIMGKQHDTNSSYLSADWSLTEIRNGVWEYLLADTENSFTAVANDLTSLKTPKRPYYTFKGWYTTAELTGEAISDPELLVEGVKLYAKWEETAPVTGLELTNKIDELLYKGTYVLEWKLNPTDASNPNVKFISSDEDVITVNSKGELLGVGEGTATITIVSESNPDAKDSVTITVYSPDRIHAEFVGDSYAEVDESLQIHAEFISRVEGEYVLEWSSSDETIAVVDQNGLVTGKAPGTVVITVKVQGTDIKLEIDVTIVDGEMSELMQLILKSHNSNVYVTEQMLIALAYRTDIHGSVSDLLYNYDYKLDESITIPVGSNRPGQKMTSIEFITVHYTAGAPAGSNAKATANYFKNGGGGASIHYCTGNDGIYHTMPDDEVAYHAGDGTSEKFEWIKTGVKVEAGDPARPVVDVASDGYFTVNGKKTTVKCPGGYDKNLQQEVQPNDQKNYFGLLGPGIDVFEGEYHIGTTWWCNSQVAEGRVSSHGGNLNSIGIESACNMGSDLWYTWQITAQLVAHLMEQNDLAINRVVGHNFFSGKNCPQPLLEYEGEIWWQFIECVESEYEVLTKYQDYEISFTSNDSNIVNDKGRVVSRPLNTTSVSYTVTITKDGQSETITLSSLVPGYYEKVME